MHPDNSTPRPGLHHDELAVDVALVRQLLAAQAPELAHLEPVRLDSPRTSNHLFRLGPDKVMRLPRRPASAAQVAKEHTWLPRLAPSLPLRVPTPLVQGGQSEPFPWPWSVLEWIEGRAVRHDELVHSHDAAIRLAHFVRALRDQDATDGPPPGAHNSGRGEPLADRDVIVRRCIGEVADLFDPAEGLALWDAALATRQHEGPPAWLHGDLLPGNLLVNDGTLTAVIDFGLLGVGDPACDLMPAWALFGSAARATFRRELAPDNAAWQRGRGWALAFASVALPYYRPMNHPLAEIAARTMAEVLADGAG